MDLYLAGADSYEKAVTLKAFNYPFRLCSYHYLKSNKKREEIIEQLSEPGVSAIMDSGLYSLMFGSEQGTLTTYDEYKAYAEQYVQDMIDWKWPHAIVECDVQRVLGVDECNRLREDVLDKSPHEVIYVWHLPEKEEGLRVLAANKTRVALSVPELRAFLSVASGGKTGDIRKALVKMLSIIRELGTAKVHLLGCTESALLDLPADSGDSTSWIAAGTWGKGKVPRIGGSLETVHIYSPKFMAWLDYAKKHPRWKAAFAELDKWVEDNRTEEQQPGAKFYTEATASGVVAYSLVMEVINAR